MLCTYNSIFGCALLWDQMTTLISHRDEWSIMLCYVTLCTTLFPHLYLLSYIHAQCYLPFWHLHSEFVDFNNRVCRVMKSIVAEINPNIWALTQQTFCFIPDGLARAKKMPVTTASVATDQGQLLLMMTVMPWWLICAGNARQQAMLESQYYDWWCPSYGVAETRQAHEWFPRSAHQDFQTAQWQWV